MGYVICTLFEGNYHVGVAALVNSLYRNGFRGEVFAGYRGNLPAWAVAAKTGTIGNWQNCTTVEAADGLTLHFIPLTTDYHLTNYKPDFMLQLLDGPAKDAEGIYYFDPDIVVVAPWSFLERWVQCGVALCEDINSPLTENHPTRVTWREYFGKLNINLSFKSIIYVNGGFTGVHVKNRAFLTLWQKIQEGMAPAIGGLNKSAFTTGTPMPEEAQGPFAPFGRTDQDALNATVEAWEGKTSIITQEGMAFRPGLPVMPHALGSMKPWKWRPLKQIIAGRAPRLVDKEYWKYSTGPLVAHSSKVLKSRKILIPLAVFISRFYKR